MTQANKKFEQLNRKIHAINAWKTLQDKQTKIKEKFPYCRGIFDTCPSEEELNSLLQEKKSPKICGRCPVFQESNVKNIETTTERKITAEDEELRKKIFGK